MNLQEADIQALLERILASSKYRESGLNEDTVLNLIHQEAQRLDSEKAIYKSVRRKLHNIVAPYLGEPEYAALSVRLDALENPALDSPALRDLCREVLAEHASTAERLPHQSEFYRRLFAVTGTPASILDLACGLHPLAFPWMGLPPTVQYHVYDIVQPRLDFINRFFQAVGLEPLAENRDILVHPPQLHTDLALFFKEAHRFEKRQPGCNRAFWASLQAEVLVVSLPTRDLAGTHSLLEQHRNLVYTNLPEKRVVEELLFDDEILFVIKRMEV